MLRNLRAQIIYHPLLLRCPRSFNSISSAMTSWQASKVLVEQLAKQVAKELESTLTRIRLGTNNADRNSDIIILLLNTLMGYQPFKTFIPDDTPQLAKAKALEKERIVEFRQKKLDAKAKKENLKKSEESFVQLTIPEDDLI